jgi:TPR repeat protein
MAPDPAQAQHWFERAQALGHPLAPAGLAWCEISGCVTSPNPAAASRWTTPLARTAPGLAKYLDWYAARALAPLGKALDRALGVPAPQGTPGAPGAHATPSTAASPTRAAAAVADPQALLQAAAHAGNAQAMNALGLEYVAAGLPDKALAQFRAASSQSAAAAANARMLSSQTQAGSRPRSSAPSNSFSNTTSSPMNSAMGHPMPPPSTSLLGDPITHPAGTATGTPLAADAAPGSPDYAQAQRYHRGDGVPANYTEAVRLYQAAASQGDARARKMLELIFSRPAPGGALDPAWMQQLASLALQPQGLTRTAPLPLSPQAWQQDPSPLYHLIPLQWRQAAP